MGKQFDKYEWVTKVERIDALTVHVVYATRMTTVHKYKMPEECLSNFLRLQSEFKEAWSFYGDK